MKFIGGGGGGETLDTGHGPGHVICICTHAMNVYMWYVGNEALKSKT